METNYQKRDFLKREKSYLGALLRLFIIFQSVVIIWFLTFDAIRPPCLHYSTIRTGWTLDRVAPCVKEGVSAGTSFAGDGHLVKKNYIVKNHITDVTA